MNLSEKARELFLEFVANILPQPNNIPKSYRVLKTFLKPITVTETILCTACDKIKKLCDCDSKLTYTVHKLDFKQQLDNILKSEWSTIERYKSKLSTLIYLKKYRILLYNN